MIERGGAVVIRMLENVQQMTIKPLIQATIAPSTLVYTDEYDIYSRLEEWGYDHESVCHSAGEYARDDDGDGFCEVHVNTIDWDSLSSSTMSDDGEKPCWVRSWKCCSRSSPESILSLDFKGCILRPLTICRGDERIKWPIL